MSYVRLNCLLSRNCWDENNAFVICNVDCVYLDNAYILLRGFCSEVLGFSFNYFILMSFNRLSWLFISV